MKKLFITLIIILCSIGFNSCSVDGCMDKPDSLMFFLFDITDVAGNSLLKTTYNPKEIVVYNIEDSLKNVQYWARPQDPSIFIQYFRENIDVIGANYRKYGIKLNSTDTDTLELYVTINPNTGCEYPRSTINLKYNNENYEVKSTHTVNFIKR